jgi:TPP-dependent pyruvate/acetoin dehydrogenase alpha subunit
MYLQALKKIIKIRVIENLICTEFKKNKIFSFLHLYNGQEACAVGVALATRKQDIFFGNHRSHGHYLSKEGNLAKMIYEVFGDTRGCCGGYGGSMHLLDKSKNFFGSVPILGSSVSIASGLAMSMKLKKKNSICVVFVGDGSAEEGSFYETVNLAGLYKLPLLIVIEDNRYAVESDFKKRKVSGYNFSKIFKEGMQAEYIRTDGQDFKKVFESALLLRKNILRNKKIGILHLDCLRFAKHSGANISDDDQKSTYRSPLEYKEIVKRDPIKILTKHLLNEKKKLEFIKKLERDLTLMYTNDFYKIFKTIELKKV